MQQVAEHLLRASAIKLQQRIALARGELDVPRAYVLAFITAKNPISNKLLQTLLDAALVLDGQIGDA